MRRCMLFALVACSSSAPAPKEPAEPIPLKAAPTPTNDAPIANVAPPDDAPTPTTPAPTGTAIARPCSRTAPIVFTVAVDTRTHEQLCTIVNDYITYLGPPSLRAPDLALQLTATVTDGPTASCKISIDVHLRTKLVMTVDGGAKLVTGQTSAEVARDDCMRALVNDQLGRQIVPALVRAGVGPSAAPSGSNAGSGATPP